MTPEILQAFESLKRTHGSTSIGRVERMMNPRTQDRHPLQEGAKWIMPGISKKPWHDPHEHPRLRPIIQQLEAQHAAIKAEYAAVWSGRAACVAQLSALPDGAR